MKMIHSRSRRIQQGAGAGFAAVLLLAAGGFAPVGGEPAMPAALCSIRPPPTFSARRTRDIVQAAEVVVRAAAIGHAPAPPRSARPNGYYMSFAVLETIKGTTPADTLVFMGGEDDRDSFREPGDDTVPYTTFHRWYGGGDCIAGTYRPGAEYLLLLGRREEKGDLDPYWQFLAPTAEQIRGADDPWVTWVRQALAAGR
ncbi:hypothetical protein [Longimicrobium sp.]|uniref:hypothetical protein n=1 Tax=Longimicrobium sp. TaxID=2029185 RepID=UPI003B3BCAA5